MSRAFLTCLVVLQSLTSFGQPYLFSMTVAELPAIYDGGVYSCVNSSGQIGGNFRGRFGEVGALSTSNGTRLEHVSTVSLAEPSWVSGINDQGDAVGNVGQFMVAWWGGTRFERLSNDYRMYPRDINSSREIVGFDYVRNMSFFWSRQTGVVHVPSPFRSWLFLNSINDAGLAVGWARTASGRSAAVTWTKATGVRLLPLAEGFLDAGASYINSSGDILGLQSNSFGRQGCVWKEDRVVLLPDFDPTNEIGVNGIDDQGRVFGSLEPGSVPCVWLNEFSAPVDLYSLVTPETRTAGKLWGVRGVSPNGRVTGQCFVGGKSSAYLVTPLQ